MREKGQGTVYQKDGAFIARLRFTDELGRKREKTFKSATKPEATARLKTFRKELATGTARLGKDPTMAEVFDRLMAEVYGPKLRSSTYVQYDGIVRNHLRPLRDVKLSKLNVEVIETILGDETKGRRTREMIRRFLITSLNHAVRLGMTGENFAKRTLPIGGEPKIVRGLSAMQVRAILDHAPSHMMRTAFRTQVELGLRVGELLGIHLTDLDPVAKTVAITRQVQRDRRARKLVLGPLKTAKSRRTLPVSDTLLAELTALGGTSAFLFPSEVGGPLEPRNYGRSLELASKLAGIGHVHSHQLRHSYGEWALAVGVDLGTISAAMGHSQLSVTMRYAMASTEVIRAGNDRLATLLN